MLIYSPVDKSHMFIEYVNSIMIDPKDECRIWKMGDDIQIDDQHEIVIFLQVIPNKDNQIIFKNKKLVNVFICNTEQLSRYTDAFTFNIIPFYEYIRTNNYNVYFGIIDYSRQNLEIIKKNKIISECGIESYYIPYQYNKNEVNFLKSNQTGEKKIFMCGCKSDRRTRVLDILLNEGLKVDRLIGFGRERDIKMMKYKIMLNLSMHDDFNIYEHIRCDRLIFSGMVIVSDHKIGFDDGTLDVCDLVIWSSVENLSDTICNVMKNCASYRERITDERIEKIANSRSKIYSDFRNKFSGK
jgi:hypothetical protein